MTDDARVFSFFISCQFSDGGGEQIREGKLALDDAKTNKTK